MTIEICPKRFPGSGMLVVTLGMTFQSGGGTMEPAIQPENPLVKALYYLATAVITARRNLTKQGRLELEKLFEADSKNPVSA